MKKLRQYLYLLLSEALKNVAKVPGWIPLAAICFALSYRLLPDRLPYFGCDVATPKEVVALLATAVLYAIGDIVDATFFDACTRRCLPPLRRVRIAGRKRLRMRGGICPPPLRRARIAVRKRLRMRGGIYRVAYDVVVAAGRYEFTCIQMKNELAKCARSLIVPALAGFIALALKADLLITVFGVFVVALVILYFSLKISHMVDIYNLVVRDLINDPKFSFHDLPNGVRMFFWEGKFVASGKLF